MIDQQSPAARRPGELVGIQYLRGLAAMLVVVFHLEPQLRRMGYDGGWLPGLSAGVDIFFVISGFIMWATTCDRPVGTLEFWRRRITRIVPLYWTMTLLMVAVMLLAPRLLQGSAYDLPHIVASFLFFPFEHPVKHVMEPVVMPGWTLNYEMFFYLIFGLFLIAGPRVRLWGTIAVLATLVAIGRIVAFPPASIGHFYTSDMMLEFAIGMLLGAIAVGRGFGRVPLPAAILLLTGGLVLLVLTRDWPVDGARLIPHGLPAAAMVLGTLVIETHRRVARIPLLHALGDASYSIYLTQLFSMSAASQLWRKLHLDQLPGGLLLFCLATTVAAALTGWLCYRFVERPLIHLFRPGHRKNAARAIV